MTASEEQAQLPPAGTAWVGVEVGTEAQPQLVRWSVWYPPGHARGARWGLFHESYALRTPTGTVLIDPARPEAAAERRVRDLVEAMGGRPLASILTNDNHERDAYYFREAYGVPVWGPAAGEEGYEGLPDHLYDERQPLPGELLAIKIEGRHLSDRCLLGEATGGTRVLFVGDTLDGQHHEFDPRGFPGGPHAEPGLYLGVSGKHARGATDRAQFKASLGRLLAHDFDIVCPAHDRPYRDNPKAELARPLGG
jgi:hypothetical protein